MPGTIEMGTEHHFVPERLVVAVLAAPLIFRMYSLNVSDDVDPELFRSVGTTLTRIFLVQILFTGPLLRRFGIAVTILVLLVAIGFGSSMILAFPLLWAVLLTSLDPGGAAMRLLASPFVGVRS